MKKILFVALAMFFAVQLTSAQTTITGKVTKKSDGKPIAGALVKVKENNAVKTTTAADGTYTIQMPAGGKNLAVTAAGFKGQIKAPGKLTVQNFILDIKPPSTPKKVSTPSSTSKSPKG